MKHRRKKRTKVNLLIVTTILLLMMIGILAIWGMKQVKKVMRDAPEEMIVEYMEHIEKQEYDAMYSMIDTEKDFYLSKEEYIERNSKIYEGIEIKNLRLNHIVTEKQEGKRVSVAYETSCDTESVLEEHERQKKILEIPGVMMTDIKVRSYGLGEAAAHLVGYVQAVTAEDLENHPGEGYHSNSVIGRTGMEGLFEKELKGKDGCESGIKGDKRRYDWNGDWMVFRIYYGKGYRGTSPYYQHGGKCKRNWRQRLCCSKR